MPQTLPQMRSLASTCAVKRFSNVKRSTSSSTAFSALTHAEHLLEKRDEFVNSGGVPTSLLLDLEAGGL